jgi:serine/threonine protein kinase
MPQTGEVIDDVFRVEAEIDSGNFGSVYKVHDMLEDRILALKVLRPGVHDESELRQRFEREARLVYSLQHKHIVRVYYYGETNSGLPYMAMEYLEGTDLRTLLHHHGALNPALVKRITLETLSALHAAHKLGIIHRDLKPANIFLVKDGGKGHVKVLDFGFAKALDDDSPMGDITNAGTLVGTPAYMAPELVHKKKVGPAADIYAMGLIMAEMVKGDKIIEIETVYDTILFQASPTDLNFPPRVKQSEFFDTIRGATRKALSKRFRSAEAMGDSLGGLPEYEPKPEPERERQAPVKRKLYITDEIGDDDITIPRAIGLPSERELKRLMGNAGDDEETRPELEAQSGTSIVETDERTIEREPVAEQLAEDERKPARDNHTPRPRNSTDDHSTARHTPDRGQPAARRSAPSEAADRETRPRRARTPREQAPRESTPSPVGIGEVEIEDLGQRPEPRRPKKSGAGFGEIFLGFVLGAVLLGLLLLWLYWNGNVQIK